MRLVLVTALVFLLCRTPWPRTYSVTIPIVQGATGQVQAGDATWYGVSVTPSRSRDGNWFNPLGMTCAVDDKKWGTERGAWYQVCRPRHSQYEGCVVVQVTDTGYLEQASVLVDLSRGAFNRLAPLGQGRQKVYVRRIR